MFIGKRLNDLAAIAGAPREATKKWLENHGYRVNGDGRVILTQDPNVIQDKLAANRANAAPSAPCWRCGAARVCEHRIAA